jgi:hypothetical protein
VSSSGAHAAGTDEAAASQTQPSASLPGPTTHSRRFEPWRVGGGWWFPRCHSDHSVGVGHRSRAADAKEGRTLVGRVRLVVWVRLFLGGKCRSRTVMRHPERGHWVMVRILADQREAVPCWPVPAAQSTPRRTRVHNHSPSCAEESAAVHARARPAQTR